MPLCHVGCVAHSHTQRHISCVNSCADGASAGPRSASGRRPCASSRPWSRVARGVVPSTSHGSERQRGNPAATAAQDAHVPHR
eukprot:6753803-Prymnesium_polylepis.1